MCRCDDNTRFDQATVKSGLSFTKFSAELSYLIRDSGTILQSPSIDLCEILMLASHQSVSQPTSRVRLVSLKQTSAPLSQIRMGTCVSLCVKQFKSCGKVEAAGAGEPPSTETNVPVTVESRFRADGKEQKKNKKTKKNNFVAE